MLIIIYKHVRVYETVEYIIRLPCVVVIAILEHSFMFAIKDVQSVDR